MDWEILGVAADADERQIKRAYARLLKTHRPDEDPQAFQRLREAYERALDQARWRAEHGDFEESETFFDKDAGYEQSFVPPAAETALGGMDGETDPAWLYEAQGGDSEAHPAAGLPLTQSVPSRLEELDSRPPLRIESLFSGGLDEGLAQAQAAGLEASFQKHLLQRLLHQADDEALDWAHRYLGWLTARQPEYLPYAEMEILAQRLASRALRHAHQALHAQQEEQALYSLHRALSSEWLQPLDRRDRFKAQMLELLENHAHWTPTFFEQLCTLAGWDEIQGYLPCSAERWADVQRRYESARLEAELRQLLARPPEDARHNAAWFLLADLTPGQRRQWADRFISEDWEACAELAHHIHDDPSLPERLQHRYVADWQAWRPKGHWGWARIYLWGMLWLCLYLVLKLDAHGNDERFWIILPATAVMAYVLVWIMTWVGIFWSKVAEGLVQTDVILSMRLLPRGLVRDGNGVLLLRHLLPCLAPAALVFAWGQTHAPLGVVMGLLTLAGGIRFVDVVTRGDSPAAWIQHGWAWVLRHAGKAKRPLLFAAGFALLAAIRWLLP
ncbi:DnaJ domain-containing protein [Pseudomonas sp. DTU_2021_1001937_2_SI_NGA_ILE_001]|uniref:DnaJ domain-containing protein n=1 Tax=Pseudomonas sp. DTU_2021_1001937_2_SI_NGA_ILE_001 TaxID=3077589 RepID=UPI0028FC22F6|nr:DnaJ domain-containing protein [Pseudomonas sp. DTU_2021_1001937_2_SI_NGA_ILE_001]WNW10347.1 DnaJ domain-containing protein [Pseudomonas sp. DTU_2021_1001937_2_SI_NGA_ILE_001]